MYFWAQTMSPDGLTWHVLLSGSGSSCKSICCYHNYYLRDICTICRFFLDLTSLVPTCPPPSLTIPSGGMQ